MGSTLDSSGFIHIYQLSVRWLHSHCTDAELPYLKLTHILINLLAKNFFFFRARGHVHASFFPAPARAAQDRSTRATRTQSIAAVRECIPGRARGATEWSINQAYSMA
jgi:hypothetical protein